MNKLFPAFFCVLAFLDGYSAQADAGNADAVVARMGGIEVRASEVNKILDAQNATTRGEIFKSPDALDRVVRTELIRRALLAEAKAKAWDKHEDVIQLLERAKDQILVSSYVNSIARPEPGYPVEADLKAAYEANKVGLIAPRQLHLAQIFLALPANGDKAANDSVQRKAEDIARKATEKNAEFGALAHKFSEHKESADKDGDMGWAAEDQIVPEIRAAASVLNMGEVSKPVRTAQGWHILKLVDSKATSLRLFEEVRDALTQALRQKKAEENEKKYLDALLAKTPINIDEIALGHLHGSPTK